MKIAKTFRWEMGHRLPDHPGGCKNIHGHSYLLRVEVEGTPGNDGMILDFDEISRVVRPLLAELDHCFLCQDSDDALREFLLSQGMKTTIVPFPSTVENITRMIADEVREPISRHDNVDAVTLHVQETNSSFAELRLDLGGA